MNILKAPTISTSVRNLGKTQVTEFCNLGFFNYRQQFPRVTTLYFLLDVPYRLRRS